MIRAIGERLHAVCWNALGEDARRKLLLCLFANIAVGVAGRTAVRMPRPAAGGDHLLLDGGTTAAAREAAFYNAALMHARTQDDFHPIGNLHIATVVLPAIIACAERHRATGIAFLDAMAVGYAGSAGFSRQFSALSSPRGLRSTSLYSALGAAAAVARLRGQDARGIANTIALATQSAFGTTQCWRDGSDEYQLHAANAAAQALLAAELTDAGVVGGAGALDGPSGFYSALLGRTPAIAEITADFDPDAAIVETVLKRYPVSGICQPVVRVSEQLAPQMGARRIERVLVEMNEFEMNYPGTLNAGPTFRSFSDRLMSARFCAASVLEAGRFDFAAFVRPVSAEATRLVNVIEVRAAADLGTLSCRVAITLEGGAVVRGELRDGGRELAMNWDTIGEWCAALWGEGGRDAAACERARAAVLALPQSTFANFRATLAYRADNSSSSGDGTR